MIEDESLPGLKSSSISETILPASFYQLQTTQPKTRTSLLDLSGNWGQGV